MQRRERSTDVAWAAGCGLGMGASRRGDRRRLALEERGQKRPRRRAGSKSVDRAGGRLVDWEGATRRGRVDDRGRRR